MSKFKTYTIGLLSAVTTLALILKDVGLVVSLSGSMFGCMLLLVLPAIMNIRNVEKQYGTTLFGKASPKSYGIGNRKAITMPLMQKVELGFNYAMIPIGLALTVIGCAVSIFKI